MGGYPPQTPFDEAVAGVTDANGNCTITVRLPQSFWFALRLTATASGQPAWTMTVNSSLKTFGNGGQVVMGPVYCAPGAQLVITILGATPATAVQGSLWGIQATDPSLLFNLPALASAGVQSALNAQVALGTFGPNDTSAHTVPVPAGTHSIAAISLAGVNQAPLITGLMSGRGYIPAAVGLGPQGTWVYPLIISAVDSEVSIQLRQNADNYAFVALLDPVTALAIEAGTWSQQITAPIGQKTGANSVAVVPASDWVGQVNVGTPAGLPVVLAVNTAVGAGAFVQLIAGVAGQHIYLSAGSLAASANPGRLGLSEDNATANVFLEYVGATTPLPVPSGGVRVTKATGHGLYVFSDNAVTVNGWLAYAQG